MIFLITLAFRSTSQVAVYRAVKWGPFTVGTKGSYRIPKFQSSTTEDVLLFSSQFNY